MQYVINYNETTGQILGFAKLNTNKNIEVSNAQWIEAQKFNKIIITDEVITFDRVDWRTPSQIAEDITLEKWNAVNNYLNNEIPNITYTLPDSTVHEYIVKKGSIEEIKDIANATYIDDATTYEWIQDGIPPFTTTKFELSIIAQKWHEARQLKIAEIFA